MLLFRRGFMPGHLALHPTRFADNARAIVHHPPRIWSAASADLVVRSMDGVVHLALLLLLIYWWPIATVLHTHKQTHTHTGALRRARVHHGNGGGARGLSWCRIWTAVLYGKREKSCGAMLMRPPPLNCLRADEDVCNRSWGVFIGRKGSRKKSVKIWQLWDRGRSLATGSDQNDKNYVLWLKLILLVDSNCRIKLFLNLS